MALGDWEYVDGYAAGHGLDALEMPLQRFTNFVWWLATRNSEPKESAKLRAQIWRPPPQVKTLDERSPWSPKNEANAFAALKAGLGK